LTFVSLTGLLLVRFMCAAVSEYPLLMPHLWYGSGMARTRISTTVDTALLTGARRARSGLTDSALIDEALAALLARQRAAEIDAAYAAYDVHPIDEHDEWESSPRSGRLPGRRDCPSGAW
jgi:hypothetical protein